jgi:hypothetical protein
MNSKQVEISNLLFRWNVNKPLLPRVKPSPMSKEFEEDYEKFKVDRYNYILTLETEFEKYPVIKCEMKQYANNKMDLMLEEAKDKARKIAIQEMQPILVNAIKKLHTTFYSMLSTQEQVLGISRDHTSVINALQNIKNEELSILSKYVHGALLYALEMIEIVIGNLMDMLDTLEEKNKECKKKLVEMFEANISKYDSLSAGLGLELPIYVIELDHYNSCYIKEKVYDMTAVSEDIGRLWSLL